MADGDIPSLIAERASAYGVDPGVLLSIAKAESGLNPGAAASSSSAKGLFQFTAPTWASYGNGANPNDPYASADAGARFTRDNAAALTKAGLAADPGALYLAHFAGPQGAIRVIQADPGASARSVLGDAAVKANPFLADMSATDLKSWAARKMGQGSQIATAPSSPPSAAALGAAGPTTVAPTPATGGLPPPSPGMLSDLLAQSQQEDPHMALLAARAKQLMAGQAPQEVPQLAPLNMPLPRGIINARLRAAALGRGLAG